MMKRVLDIVASACGLVLLAPLLAGVFLLIKLDSPGPVFFRQERVGRGFRPFFIYKFRTMVRDAARRGSRITSGEDPRVTRCGRFLRRAKIDELPQLINVLRGDMSLVGPRPEVPHYVNLFRQDFEEILRVRPGITDLASLEYRDEASLLGRFANPEAAYVSEILPNKIRLAKTYIRSSSPATDLRLILRSLSCLWRF